MIPLTLAANSPTIIQRLITVHPSCIGTSAATLAAARCGLAVASMAMIG
jgi:hypothetical protein